MKNKTLFFTLAYLLLAATHASAAAEKDGDCVRLPKYLYKLILPAHWTYLQNAEFLHLMHKSSPHHPDLTKFSFSEDEARAIASTGPIAHSGPAKAVFLTSEQVEHYIKGKNGSFVVLKIATEQLLIQANIFEGNPKGLLFSHAKPFDGAIEKFFHYPTQAGTLPLSCVTMVTVYRNEKIVETGHFTTQKNRNK